ncbi:MAG: acyltransferase family protein [Parvibaculum sp.]
MVNPATKAKRRIDWIDSVKGLTIALVVIEHTTYGVQASTHHLPEIFGVISEFAKPFRMPLFFLVAGLFAQKALYADRRTFLDGKVLHFAYFYVLWSVIQIGIKMLPHTGGNWDVTYVDLLMIPIQPFAALWFIYELALFFCVLRLLRDASKLLVFLFAIAIYFSMLDTGWMLIDEFAWRFVWFVAGIHGARYVFDIASWAQSRAWLGLALGATLLASVASAVFSGLINIRAIELLMGFAGAGGAIMLMSVLAARGLTRPLAFLGARSIYVFLAFFLPMGVTRIVMLRLGVESGDLITLVAATAGIIAPLIAYRLVVNTPLSFLFVRPQMFRLTGKSKSSVASQAVST